MQPTLGLKESLPIRPAIEVPEGRIFAAQHFPAAMLLLHFAADCVCGIGRADGARPDAGRAS